MFHSIPQTSGVYQILCIPTDKVYIGSAWNMHKRCRQHISDLSAQRHRNIHLQRAWNRYGPDAFVFSVVELADVETVRDCEQYHLDRCRAYDDRFGFNIAPGVDNKIVAPETGRRISEAKRGHVVSDETRAKLRAARLAQPDPALGFRRTAEQRARQSERQRGRQHSPQMREFFIRNNLARTPEREAARLSGVVKSYLVTAPDGTVYHVTNLSEFCRLHGLGDGLHKVAAGKRKQYKGWRCEDYRG